MSVDLARQVADAVLYEGYVLYPYRASSAKNQVRWQFGVLVPRDWSEAGGGEAWASQTECPIEPGANARLGVTLRFLQTQTKTVETALDAERDRYQAVASLDVDGETFITWDEGTACEVEADVALANLLSGERAIPFEIPGEREVEPIRATSGEIAGRIVRERWPLAGELRMSAERPDGPYGVGKVRLRVENVTPWAEPGAGRDEAVRRSLVAAHSLLSLRDGAFISLLEPPEWAKPLAASCRNVGTWPVLIGEAGRRDLMLSSPIILYDYPQIAAESPGDLYDATEIDEILTLRTMALTDDEKREARATDPRSAAILDRVDNLPPEIMERLHGAVRAVRDLSGPITLSTPTEDADEEPERLPWWDPGTDASVSPETDSVDVGGVAVAAGSRVRLRPGGRRSDAQDMFLAGRIASVEAVFHDVDGRTYLAIIPEDDPGADLLRWQKRFIYFAPDEVEPVEPLEARP